MSFGGLRGVRVGFANMRLLGWRAEGLGGFLLVLPFFLFGGLFEDICVGVLLV